MVKVNFQIKLRTIYKLLLVTTLSFLLSFSIFYQLSSKTLADNVRTRVKISNGIEEPSPEEPPDETTPPVDDTDNSTPTGDNSNNDPTSQQDSTGTSSTTKKNSSSSSKTSDTSTSSTSNLTDLAPISSVVLSSVFKNSSSRTSDLSNLTNEEAAHFKNFIIEDVLFGMIQFTEEVDLSGEDIAQKFAELSKYIKIEKGKVYVDSENLPQLNKRARVSIYNQNLVPNEFSVYRDNTELDSEQINLDYASKAKIVSFDVAGFSTYIVKPNLVIETPDSIDTKTAEYPIRGRVGDLDSQVTINLSGEEEKFTMSPEEDGSFEHIFKLNEGQNEVVILVKFSNGDATIIKQEITYRPQSIIGFAGSVIDGGETYIYVVLTTALFVMLFFGVEKGREMFIATKHY